MQFIKHRVDASCSGNHLRLIFKLLGAGQNEKKNQNDNPGGKQKFKNVQAADDHLSNLYRMGLMHYALSFLFDVQ